jgi:hypothetical protein
MKFVGVREFKEGVGTKGTLVQMQLDIQTQPQWIETGLLGSPLFVLGQRQAPRFHLSAFPLKVQDILLGL